LKILKSLILELSLTKRAVVIQIYSETEAVIGQISFIVYFV